MHMPPRSRLKCRGHGTARVRVYLECGAATEERVILQPKVDGKKDILLASAFSATSTASSMQNEFNPFAIAHKAWFSRSHGAARPAQLVNA